MIPANMEPPNAAHIRTVNEFAFPIISWNAIVSADAPRAALPLKYNPTIVVTITKPIGIIALYHLFSKFSGSSSSLRSAPARGFAPSLITFPVSCARLSAVNIGPKSRPRVAVITINPSMIKA